MIPPIFVIWGYASENILLSDFANAVHNQGHEILALPNEGISRQEELTRLLSTPFILLTSAHFTRDAQNLASAYPNIKIGADFLEILFHAKPILSVFYPHDLTTPLVLNEPALLSAFDLVLWPTPFFGYQPKPAKFHNVGWISYRNAWKPPAERSHDCVWFFSDLTSHVRRYGIDRTYEKISPILNEGVAIKFPYWPGHVEFEEAFRARGVHVIPAQQHTGDTIQDTRVAVANGISGIIIEASAMGTPVVALPSENAVEQKIQCEFFSAFPGVVLSRPEEFLRRRASLPPVLRPCIDPFDAQAVLDLILHEAEEKLATSFDYPPCSQADEIVFLTPGQENTISLRTGNEIEDGIRAFNAGDYAAAIEFLSAAMTQEPDNPLPFAYLGFIAAHQGLLQEAADFIAQADRVAPGRADIKAAFGEEMLKTGHPEIAAIYLKEAIELQPDLLTVYPTLAQSLHLVERGDGKAMTLPFDTGLTCRALLSCGKREGITVDAKEGDG
ncbi:MAG: tetratricopeptide repeat protein [Azoarcus sp.]|jgi:hypothetical protein|nr:tetratricopeptide repeat protein [Azoarcus sp.]